MYPERLCEDADTMRTIGRCFVGIGGFAYLAADLVRSIVIKFTPSGCCFEDVACLGLLVIMCVSLGGP